MADPEGPLAPPITQGAQDPPAAYGPPVPPAPQVPHVLQTPQMWQQSVPHMLPLNWTHIKPKFSGKPDDDAEAHLHRTNDWMDTHRFQDNDKVQRFFLTLTEEARPWYKSLRLINADWVELQNMFRQQHSKIGNTREQFFHEWRPFHFDKNTEAIDNYIHHI